jgi:uncharacterized membrane protein YkoI
MRCAQRFAIFAFTILALTPACAEEPVRPSHTEAEPAQACLDQKERRAESEAGRVVHLAAAMHAAKRRMPGTVVRARLCHGHDGLVYVLTVLAHDGKVARLTIDAVKGTLVGGL